MWFSKGLTFVEVLIALCLIGMLYAIALPLFTDLFAKHRAEIVKKEIMQTIRRAELAAEHYHLPVVLCGLKAHQQCVNNWQNGYILFLNPAKNGVMTKETKRLQVNHWRLTKAAIKWRAFPKYRQYVLFLPSAFGPVDNGTIWYCVRGEAHPSWVIAVGRMGGIREYEESERARVSCEAPSRK